MGLNESGLRFAPKCKTSDFGDIFKNVSHETFESSVSSVSGGYVHIKIKVPDEKVDLSSLNENKIFDPKLQKKTTLGEYLGQQIDWSKQS